MKFGPDGQGQTILDPVPYYDNKSADIGGGAVGLVPYYCYYKDCTPTGFKRHEAADGADGLGECEDWYHAIMRVSPYTLTSTVTIRHYGPIWQDGTGKPFIVLAKPINTDPCDGGGNPNWLDVTGGFTHNLPAGDPRAIEITGPFADAYDYLIRPRTTGSVVLACDDVTASSTVPVKPYDFRVGVFYLQNTTMSDGLEAGDIVEWVNNPVDTTLDGVVDGDDLADVVEAVAEFGGQ